MAKINMNSLREGVRAVKAFDGSGSPQDLQDGLAPVWLMLETFKEKEQRAIADLTVRHEIKALLSGPALDWYSGNSSSFFKDDKFEVAAFKKLFSEQWLGARHQGKVLLDMMTATCGPRQSPQNYANQLDRDAAQLAATVAVADLKKVAFIQGLGSEFAALSDDLEWPQTVRAAQRMYELGSVPNPKRAHAAAVLVSAAASEPILDPKSGLCWLCDQPGHSSKVCPTAKCARCGAMGHIAGACAQRKPVQYSRVPRGALGDAGRRRGQGSDVGGEAMAPLTVRARSSASASAPSSHSSIAAVSSRPMSGGKRIWVDAQLGGRSRKALVDSGADCSLVRRGALQGAQWRATPSVWAAVEAPGGGAARVLGGAQLSVLVGRRRIDAEFVVVADGDLADDAILGADVLGKLGVMHAVEARLRGLGAKVEARDVLGRPTAAASSASDGDRYEDEAAVGALDLSHLDDVPDLREEVRALLLAHRKCFLRDGRLPEAALVPPVHIDVVGPPKVAHERPWSPEYELQLRAHEELFKRDGLASDATRSRWRSEPHLVAKKDGTTRYVVDHAHANPSLAFNAYPMGDLEREAAKLDGGLVFSSVDFAHGFFQLALDSESQEITTVRSTTGLMRFSRMTMGLNVAPAEFNQAVRSTIIAGLKREVSAGTAHWVDDLAQAGKGDSRRLAVQDGIAKLRSLLQLAAKFRFAFRLKKCSFLVPSIVWCGMSFTPEGRRIADEKGRAILHYGEFRTKKQLLRFLGMANRFRSSIRRFDVLAAPLYAACKRDAPMLRVTEGLHQQIEAMKRAVADAPYRTSLRPGEPIDVEVDASGFGRGAVLTQGNRLIDAFSQAAKKEERNYSAFDKEWLAILSALQHFQRHLQGRAEPIRVWTDHEGLEALETRAHEDKLNRRARWVEWRQTLPRHVVKYKRKGANIAADAMSRAPWLEEQARIEARPTASDTGPADTEPVRDIVAVAAVVSARHVDGAWWREQQVRDPLVKQLIDFKEGVVAAGTPLKELSRLAAVTDGSLMAFGQGGMLVHLWSPKDGRPKADTIEQVVVPDVKAGDGRSLRRVTFERLHVEEGGHMKAGSTFERLRRLYFWDTMWADCQRWVKECHVCVMHDRVPKNVGLLDPITPAKLAGRRTVGMDLIGPLPPTTDGHTHVLVAVDYATSWVYTAPLRSTTSEAVSAAFRAAVVDIEDVPDHLITDQGSNLTAEHAEAIYEDLGIVHQPTAAVNPQADGKVERSNGILKSVLAKTLAQYGGSWGEQLSAATAILNDSFKRPGRISPFEARFGRSRKSPACFDRPEQETKTMAMKEMKAMKEKMTLLIEKAAEEMKRRFDEGRKEAEFAVGDLVRLRDHDKKDALAAKSVGPFEVEEVLSPLNLRLKATVGGPPLGRRKPVVNVKHVAPYEPKDVPGAREWSVEDVIDHKGKGKRKLYHVRWSTGETSWEPRNALVDMVDGEEVVNASLQRYWQRNPWLGR